MDSDIQLSTDDHLPPGTEVVELPNVVVHGHAVNSLRTRGTEGEEHALVVISFEFQPSPGKVGRQAFIMEKATASALRLALKNPKPLNLPTDPSTEENPTS